MAAKIDGRTSKCEAQNRELLRVCERIVAQGDRLSFATIASRMGISDKAARARVLRMKKAGKFPYETVPCRDKNDFGYMQVIAAVEAMVKEGVELTRSAIAKRAGCDPAIVPTCIQYARKLGLFPYKFKSGRGAWSAEEKAKFMRAQRERRMAAIEVKPEVCNASSADAETIAAIQAEWFKDMIDGRDEQDETPHGVPPRSNKDHAAWGRRKFINHGEARAHKVYRHHRERVSVFKSSY